MAINKRACLESCILEMFLFFWFDQLTICMEGNRLANHRQQEKKPPETGGFFGYGRMRKTIAWKIAYAGAPYVGQPSSVPLHVRPV